MIDPRPCDLCRRDIERDRSVYAVVIDAQTLEPRIRRRTGPRCARAELRRRRFGAPEQGALETVTGLLERAFGASPGFQGDRRSWAVLCRRTARGGR